MKLFILLLTLFIFSCSDSTTSSESSLQVDYQHVDCITNQDCDGALNHCVEVIYNAGREDEARMRECLSDCNKLELDGEDAYIYKTVESGLCTKNKH